MTEHAARTLTRSRNLLLLAVASIALGPLQAFAQSESPASTASTPTASTPAKQLTYDVVSIRLNKSVGQGGSMRSTPDGFTDINQSLVGVIGPAYGVEHDEVYGLPAWVESNRYDIQAKVAGEDIEAYHKLRGRQTQLMMQAVLEDRLKLKAHLGTKEVPMYQLVIAKNGPKLHKAKPGDTYKDGLKLPDGTPLAGSGLIMGRGQFTGQQVTVSALLNSLKGATGRNVLDKTGLTGKYDITLHWAPDQAAPEDAAPTDAGPSIFSALEEQLGLKLEPSRGTIKTLIIDHIEQPSEN